MIGHGMRGHRDRARRASRAGAAGLRPVMRRLRTRRIAPGATLLLCIMLLGASPLAAEGSFHLIGGPPGTSDPHPAALSADGSTLMVVALPDGEDGSQSYRWSFVTGWQPLDRLPGFGDVTHVVALDADGDTAVGLAGARRGDGSLDLRPFRWTAAAGMVDLTHLGVPEDFEPWTLSADGRLVGGRADLRPAVWSADAGLSFVETPPLDHGVVRDVSSDGLVALGYYAPSGESSPFDAEGHHWFIESAGELVFDQEEADADGETVALRSLPVLASDGSAAIGVGWQSDAGEDRDCLVRATEQDGVACLAELLEHPSGAFERFGATANGGSVVGSYPFARFDDPDAGQGLTWAWHGFAWDADGGMREIEALLVDEHALDVGEIGRLLPVAISDDGRVIAGDTHGRPDSPQLWIALLDPACSDGFDARADGPADHPDDPGCSPAHQASEQPGVMRPAQEACGRGFALALAVPLAITLRRRPRAGG